MKKVFIISSVAFLILLIFWGIYSFAFKDNSGTKKESEKITEQDLALPLNLEEENPNAKIKDISGEGVIAPVIRAEGNKILFYAAIDGRVFSIEFDGTGKSVISSQMLAGLSEVIWSTDRKKVIAEFDEGKRKTAYNYETKTGKELGAGTYNFAWSNLDDKLLYQFKNGKTNELSVADPDGSNWKKIIDITFSRITIAPIPQTSLVTFWNYPNSGEETALFAVGIMGGEAKKIFSGKFGADYLWSPNGKKGLVSFAEKQNGSKTSLGVINADGSNFRDLGIPTVVSKCLWSSDEKTVFYALPGNIAESAVMPNDYQDGKFKTKDTFWKVNIETGEKSRLIELEDLSDIGVSFDAASLFLSDKEKDLFFINRLNRHLYRLEL